MCYKTIIQAVDKNKNISCLSFCSNDKNETVRKEKIMEELEHLVPTSNDRDFFQEDAPIKGDCLYLRMEDIFYGTLAAYKEWATPIICQIDSNSFKTEKLYIRRWCAFSHVLNRIGLNPETYRSLFRLIVKQEDGELIDIMNENNPILPYIREGKFLYLRLEKRRDPI